MQIPVRRMPLLGRSDFINSLTRKKVMEPMRPASAIIPPKNSAKLVGCANRTG